MKNLKTYKEFKSIFENNYEKSVSGLSRFGLMDYSVLHKDLVDFLKEEGFSYNKSYVYSELSNKHYIKMVNFSNDMGEKDEIDMVVSSISDAGGKFNKDTGIILLISANDVFSIETISDWTDFELIKKIASKADKILEELIPLAENRHDSLFDDLREVVIKYGFGKELEDETITISTT